MTDRAETLAWTTELVRDAGRRALAMLARERTVEHKADGTVVTDIDRTVEQFIRKEIGDRFSAHAILGEEFGYQARADAPVWAIDPIDGTTNLANGLPQWGVSVGLIENGAPVIGAVFFPLLDELYAAAAGLGATRNGVALPSLAPADAISGDDVYGICSYTVNRMTFGNIPARLRLTGSAALDACWTGSGSFRGSQSLGVKLYDIAAGFCIAHEVGARSVWLRTGEPWSATEMLREGKRENDVLLTAAPALLPYLRRSLTLRGAVPES